MMNLFELQGARKGLKPTATIVRDRRGQVVVEREELLSTSERDEKIQASIAAGKIRKGLPSSSPVENKNQYPIQPIQSYEYDYGLSKWMPVICDKIGIDNDQKQSTTKKLIRVVTFNVWFSKYQWQRRLDALVKLCIEECDKKEASSEIICLQEVTPRFLTKLLQYEVVRDQYRVVHNVIRSYGVGMLVSKELTGYSISSVVLPTQMGRAALMAHFSTIQTNKNENEQSSLVIGTVHLESLNNQKIRAQQLSILNEAMSGYDTAILCGDFNITATGPWANALEDKAILAEHLIDGFEDLWVRCFPEKDGFTFDSQENSKQFSSFHDSSRYDRVCVRENQHKPVRCQNIQIIGDEPIPSTKEHKNSGVDVFVSDHFGLYFEINLVKI